MKTHVIITSKDCSQFTLPFDDEDEALRFCKHMQGDERVQIATVRPASRRGATKWGWVRQDNGSFFYLNG